MRYKGKALFLALLLGILFAIPGFAALTPTKEFYVNDFAGVLSFGTKEHIVSHSAALADETNAQIVVVTVSSLEGKDARDFAFETAREFKIGGEKENNGILIFLAPNDGEIRIEVGYGLEGAVNDAKAGRFIDDYALSDLQAGDFDAGIKTLYDAVLAEVYKEYQLEIPTDIEIPQAYEPDSGLVVAIIVIVLLIFLMNFPGGGRKRRFFGGFFGPPPPGPFGGGGFGGFHGGGSSGGFGGFRGGGGSFGGGGAGRKF